jgi:hypothetical protein
MTQANKTLHNIIGFGGLPAPADELGCSALNVEC